MNLKKKGKVFTSKYVGTGLSAYEKRIYRAAVSQRFGKNGLDNQLIGGLISFTSRNAVIHSVRRDTWDSPGVAPSQRSLRSGPGGVHSPFIAKTESTWSNTSFSYSLF